GTELAPGVCPRPARRVAALGRADRENRDQGGVKTSGDVVIVGAGASGLAAAIEAARAGADVLVLEKNAQPGGSSRLSVGSINAAGTCLQQRAAIVDTPDEHCADMYHFMGPFAAKENRALRRILVDNA